MAIMSCFTCQVYCKQSTYLLNLKLSSETERSTFEIKTRILKDKANILKICDKYPNIRKTRSLEYPAQNFCINEDRNLGWCVNAKVINYY